jgi:hypothetical protein
VICWRRLLVVRERSRAGAEGHRVEGSDFEITPGGHADVCQRSGFLCACAELPAARTGAAGAASAALQPENRGYLRDVDQVIHLLPQGASSGGDGRGGKSTHF